LSFAAARLLARHRSRQSEKELDRDPLRSPPGGGLTFPGREAVRLEVLPYASDLWNRLEQEWRDLEIASDNSSFFLSGTWMAAWFGAYAADLRPEGLRFLDRLGTLVGICLSVTRSERRGPFPVRRVYFNATGEGGVLSEHNRLLTKPGWEAAVAWGLEEYVRGRGVEEVVLAGFDEDVATGVIAAVKSWRVDGYWSEDPFVDLARLRAAGQDYLASISSETRRQITRSIRLYGEASGQAAIDVPATAEDAVPVFEELRGLHEARWRGRGSEGAFANPRRLGLYRALLGTCGEECGARLLRVRFGDVTVGVLYNFVHRGRIFFSQSGFRYESDNRLKPGLVTHALAIAHCLERGYAEYDFGAGEPAAVRYKTSLGTDRRRMGWLHLQRPSAKMALIVGLQLARQRWRSRRSEPVDAGKS
jgi:hypothetical protein